MAQDPIVEWDNTLGGDESETLSAALQTADGGYLLGGISYSDIGFDKSENSNGSSDFWIVKLNASGAIEWQNTIGSTSPDYFSDMVPTTDGGYLIGGYTYGGISGDKTTAAIGGYDFWILKISATGTILWQKTIGGTGADHLTDIKSVPGGFVLSGYSDSGISGDKTEACLGGYDYWFMKINNSGTILWQFTVGGSGNDYLYETIKASDGTYILTGTSDSDVSGDKTEDNIGGRDYWVLSIDGAGVIQWQNTIGGTGYDYCNAIIELEGGGYLLGGNSTSNANGDKSEHSDNVRDWCYDCDDIHVTERDDHWIVRLNADGEIIWENTFLTTSDYSSADVASLIQYQDNRILIAGNGDAGGDNLESDGGNDYWIYAIDTNGMMLWQKVMGGVTEGYGIDEENNESELGEALLTTDGGFFLAGRSDGLMGNDKSENPLGYNVADYWVLKLSPDVWVTTPQYFDLDRDGEGTVYSHMACEPTNGQWVANNLDCDDTHQTSNTTATEICDGLDNDCDGMVDEGLIDCNPGPEIAWDATIPDSNYSNINDMVSTLDGGYISVGTSQKTFIDYPDDDPDTADVIITKLDTAGNIQWQKILIANQDDYGMMIRETPEGDFLVGANSISGISGDKTTASYGYIDIWLLKLNSAGEILWQKEFGGGSVDEITDIEITPDNGIIIAANSSSGISGNKTEGVMGSSDVWMIKLNSTGDIVWQNTIGGTDSEGDPGVVCNGTGFAVGVSSRSSDVDKTEASHGGTDYWVFGLNSSGAIIWQNTIGGVGYDYLADLDLDVFGNIIAGGYSPSAAHPDKLENSIDEDYWIVKLGPTGNVIWEKTIQAEDHDYLTALVCVDGGYIVGGNTTSGIGYDKIEPKTNKLIDNYGLNDPGKDWWLIKLDYSGEIIWQNTVGGNLNDELRAITINDSGIIGLAGMSASYASRDKSADPSDGFVESIEIDFYDDESTYYYPDQDGWILRFDEEPCTPVTELCNLFDDNCNGLIDDGVIETVTISAGGPTTFCQGGSVMLYAIHSGTSVQWYKNGVTIPGATDINYTVTAKGMYTCRTTSVCGTAISSVITVVVNKNPVASIVADGPIAICAGGSVTLTETPTAGCTYQWFKGATLLAGATTTSYVATAAGFYKCVVTKTATGCAGTSNTIHVTVTCKEDEVYEYAEPTLWIYPNPSDGRFRLSVGNMMITNSFASLRIYDMFGQVVYTSSEFVAENNYNLDVALRIPAGVYFLELVTGDNSMNTRIVIN